MLRIISSKITTSQSFLDEVWDTGPKDEVDRVDKRVNEDNYEDHLVDNLEDDIKQNQYLEDAQSHNLFEH